MYYNQTLKCVEECPVLQGPWDTKVTVPKNELAKFQCHLPDGSIFVHWQKRFAWKDEDGKQQFSDAYAMGIAISPENFNKWSEVK